jgi:hypothetical protein
MFNIVCTGSQGRFNGRVQGSRWMGALKIKSMEHQTYHEELKSFRLI